MEGFRHLLDVSAFLLAVLGVGIDTVGALDGVSDGERDHALLACGQRAVGEHRAIVLEEFLANLRLHVGDLAEIRQMLRIVITSHV